MGDEHVAHPGIEADGTELTRLDDDRLHAMVVREGRELLRSGWRFVGKVYLAHRRGLPAKKGFAVTAPGRATRAVPTRYRRMVLLRDRGLCATPSCRRVATTVHHRERFGLTRRHPIDHLFAVCDRHHELLHAGAVANEKAPAGEWRVQLDAHRQPRGAIGRIDRRVMFHRRAP